MLPLDGKRVHLQPYWQYEKLSVERGVCCQIRYKGVTEDVSNGSMTKVAVANNLQRWSWASATWSIRVTCEEEAIKCRWRTSNEFFSC